MFIKDSNLLIFFFIVFLSHFGIKVMLTSKDVENIFSLTVLWPPLPISFKLTDPELICGPASGRWDSKQGLKAGGQAGAFIRSVT